MGDTQGNDKDPGTDKGGDKGGGAGDESMVRRVVSEVLGDLFKSGKADVDDKGGKGGDKGNPDAAGIAQQVEAAVKRVRDQDARTRAEQEREARLAALEEKVAQPEKAPVQHRRITTLMWGGDE